MLCGEKWNCVLMVTTLAARNINETMVALEVGSDGVCFWRKSGVWSQAVDCIHYI
jgi:hypothetical protein